MTNWVTTEICAFFMLFASSMPIPLAVLWVLILTIVIFFGGNLHPIFAEKDHMK